VRDVELAILVPPHQVDVTVEEPRQERLPLAVDRLVAVEAGPDVDDAPVLDRDVRVGERRPRAVEDPPPAEHRPGHPYLPIRRPER